MSAPLEENAYIIEMYDSFSKAIMRNECRNLIKKNRRNNKETVVSKKRQYLFELQECRDTYPSDSFYLEGLGEKYSCYIFDERLFHAMKKLSLKVRTMLIMSFWHGMSDVEIARCLGVTTRTIFNWRRDAFKKIRHDYERGSP